MARGHAHSYGEVSLKVASCMQTFNIHTRDGSPTVSGVWTDSRFGSDGLFVPRKKNKIAVTKHVNGSKYSENVHSPDIIAALGGHFPAEGKRRRIKGGREGRKRLGKSKGGEEKGIGPKRMGWVPLNTAAPGTVGWLCACQKWIMNTFRLSYLQIFYLVHQTRTCLSTMHQIQSSLAFWPSHFITVTSSNMILQVIIH